MPSSRRSATTPITSRQSPIDMGRMRLPNALLGSFHNSRAMFSETMATGVRL